MITELKRLFVPDPPMIKKVVEDLIEREYVRRSKTDVSSYEYVA